MAFDVDVHEEALASIPFEDGVRDALLDAADPIIESARALAPKRTGAGSAAIHSEDLLAPGGWQVRIGWDTRHYYMRFQDQGSRGPHGVDARHFLEIALEGALL